MLLYCSIELFQVLGLFAAGLFPADFSLLDLFLACLFPLGVFSARSFPLFFPRYFSPCRFFQARKSTEPSQTKLKPNLNISNLAQPNLT